MSELVRVADEPKYPGEWYSFFGDLRKDQRFATICPIYICCPACGKVSSVSPDVHHVQFHGDGTFSLMPSFVCPYRPCSWHVFITRSQY